MQDYYNIISDIASYTNSELIYFFIILFVFLVVGFIPLYKFMLDRQTEREKQIIDVVKANTAAITALQTTLNLTLSNMGVMFNANHKP